MVLDVPPKYFESDTGSSAVWNDAMDESTPAGQSSVTLLPLSSKYEIFSNFGEKDCGEPSKSQHLVIDFTPDPEIDNEESQLKCCAFWDFINSKTYLKQLRVEPTKRRDAAMAATADDIPEVDENNTAMFFINQDFVEMSLESNLPASKCTTGDGSYSQIDNDKPESKTKKTPKPPPVCVCSKICTTCKKSKPATTQVQKMCKDLDDWDEQHPKLICDLVKVAKSYCPPVGVFRLDDDDNGYISISRSMEPIGPVMQYMPVLQRKLPPPQDPKTCLD